MFAFDVRRVFFVFISLLFLSSSSNRKFVDGQKHAYKMDIIAVLTYGTNEEERSSGVDQLRDAYKEFFAQRFEWGADKVRFSALQTSTRYVFDNESISKDRYKEKILSPWTTDVNKFNEGLDSYKAEHYESYLDEKNATRYSLHHDVLYWSRVADDLFHESTPDRARIIIYFRSTVAEGDSPQTGFDRLERMRRESGVIVYLMTCDIRPNKDPSKDYLPWLAAEFTGQNDSLSSLKTRRNLVRHCKGIVKDEVLEYLNEIWRNIPVDLCGWDHTCRYERDKEQGDCVLDQWRNESLHFVSVEECEKRWKPNITDEERIRCVNETYCADVCDDAFPWTVGRGVCGDRCGQAYSRNRQQLRKYERPGFVERMAKYCTAYVKCPDCEGAYEDRTSGQNELSIGAWIGIAIAILGVLGIIGALFFLLFLRRRQRVHKTQTQQNVRVLAETIRTMSVHMQAGNKGSAVDRGTGVDLESIVERSLARLPSKIPRTDRPPIVKSSSIAVVNGPPSVNNKHAAGAAAASTSKSPAESPSKTTKSRAKSIEPPSKSKSAAGPSESPKAGGKSTTKSAGEDATCKIKRPVKSAGGVKLKKK